MMPEIALNILDVAENCVRAGAMLTEIFVEADTKKDSLTVTIKDNGCGMTKEQVRNVTDPFFTSRTTRKVGLGVPFLKQAAELTGGSFSITSEVNVGTQVTAVFVLSSIDRMPLGDMANTIYSLVGFHQELDFYYLYRVDDRSFTLDTREMKEILGDVSFQEKEVADFVRDFIRSNEQEVNNGLLI